MQLLLPKWIREIPAEDANALPCATRIWLTAVDCWRLRRTERRGRERVCPSAAVRPLRGLAKVRCQRHGGRGAVPTWRVAWWTSVVEAQDRRRGGRPEGRDGSGALPGGTSWRCVARCRFEKFSGLGQKKILLFWPEKNPAHDHPIGRIGPHFSGRARAWASPTY
jgi:hypothetical protein